MRMKIHCLAGAMALVISSTALAQAKPPVQPDEPQASAPGQTQTTPGQSQTTPGEASQLTPPDTGQTPSGQPAADQAQANQLAKATAADIKKGMTVHDSKGGVVGKIVSSDSKGVVVDTGTLKASIPLSGFGKSDKGLVIAMTKAELEAAAKKNGPKPE